MPIIQTLEHLFDLLISKRSCMKFEITVAVEKVYIYIYTPFFLSTGFSLKAQKALQM